MTRLGMVLLSGSGVGVVLLAVRPRYHPRPRAYHAPGPGGFSGLRA